MKLRRILANSLVLVIAAVIGLLLCEVAARFILNPADYLSVTMEKDDILGRAVAPGTPGYDRFGFRNPGIPGAVDILTVGDSHTYGHGVRMEDSWPYQVGLVTGKTVYSMGMGGYGPNQYYHLLKTHLEDLNPRIVLCGLYMGDDFENAYSITYGLDHWSFLRTSGMSGADPDIWEVMGSPGLSKRIRVWLSRNSVLYQLVVHGPVLGWIKGWIQVEQARRDPDPSTTVLVEKEKNIREAFRPIGIEKRLNRHNPFLREGFRITVVLLKGMKEWCDRHGSRFSVVLIPTKEMVFAEYLRGNPGIPLHEIIDELLKNEEETRRELLEFLKQQDIPCIDALPSLRRSVGNGLYTKSDKDMHPNGKGYGMIAESVSRFLEEKGWLR